MNVASFRPAGLQRRSDRVAHVVRSLENTGLIYIYSKVDWRIELWTASLHFNGLTTKMKAYQISQCILLALAITFRPARSEDSSSDDEVQIITPARPSVPLSGQTPPTVPAQMPTVPVLDSSAHSVISNMPLLVVPPHPATLAFFPHYPIDTTRPNWIDTWIKPKSEASSSSRNSAKYEIPAFQHPVPHGTIWGPLQVGSFLFEPRPYPLRIPVFDHLFPLRPIQSDNFENFLLSNRRLYTHGNLYLPDPQRLFEIQTTLYDQLQARGIRPQVVVPETGLWELLWLWPPTKVNEARTGLDFPTESLNRRLRKALGARLKTHLITSDSIFHFAMGTTSGGVRHILMMPVYADHFAGIARRPRDSDLYLFYEGVKLDGISKMALLGAMFLPRTAERALRDGGIITTAFSGLKTAAPK